MEDKQLSLGKKSIYDIYQDRYDFIDMYDNFYKKIN